MLGGSSLAFLLAAYTSSGTAFTNARSLYLFEQRVCSRAQVFALIGALNMGVIGYTFGVMSGLMNKMLDAAVRPGESSNSLRSSSRLIIFSQNPTRKSTVRPRLPPATPSSEQKMLTLRFHAQLMSTFDNGSTCTIQESQWSPLLSYSQSPSSSLFDLSVSLFSVDI